MSTATTANKFRTLEAAAARGIRTVPTLYIRTLTPTTQDDIERFIRLHSAQKYLIRSAMAVEDSTIRSYAGMFFTAQPVTAAELLTTIKAVQTENTRRAARLGVAVAPHVMLCPYLETTYGGVTFAPWLYFHQHCVTEWADSAESTVAGKSRGTTAIDINTGMVTPIQGEILPTTVAQLLARTIKQLREFFSYPIDVEWGYDGTQVYVFQIRPITITPVAFTISNTPLDASFCFDQYSDTFGKLSPLSYSLLTTLYTESKLYTTTLGVRGGKPFLHRLATGEIVTNRVAIKRYFEPHGWLSTLLRPTRIALTLRYQTPPTPTKSLPTLEALIGTFTQWQLASIQAGQSAQYARPHEYELSQTIDINEYPVNSLVAKYKKDFLSLTLPLRALVQEQPAFIWGTLIEALSGNPPTRWEETYREELFHSFTTRRTSASTVRNQLLWGAPVAGPHLYIAQPLAWHKPLPPQTIISTPFIPAHWVLELPHLAGIVTTSLNQLSHAAITLREHNIPTLIVTETTLIALAEKTHLSLATMDVGNHT